jgi:hypothetical protein
MGSYQNQRHYLSPVANRHSVDCCLIGNRLCAESFDMRTRLNLLHSLGIYRLHLFLPVAGGRSAQECRKFRESHETLSRRLTRYLKGDSCVPNTRSPSDPVKNTGPETLDGPPIC